MARKTATRPRTTGRRARTAPATTAGAVPRPAPPADQSAPAPVDSPPAAGDGKDLAGVGEEQHLDADWLAEQIANARDRAADLTDLAEADAAARISEAADLAARTLADADQRADETLAAAEARAVQLRAAAETTRLQMVSADERRSLYEEVAARSRAYVDLADDRAARSLAEVRRNLDQAETLRTEAETLRETITARKGVLEDQARVHAGDVDLAARTARVALAEELSTLRQNGLDQIRADADAARQAAEDEVQRLLGAARESARTLRADAATAAEETAAEARQDAQGILAAARREAEEILARAEAATVELDQAARQRAEATVTAAQSRAADTVAAAREKAAESRKSADAYAGEVRRSAEETDTALADRIREVSRREQNAAARLAEVERREAGQARRTEFSETLWEAAPWAALAAGVGLAASGEFQLAQLVGFNWRVAWLLPVSIDIYAVTAFKRKRDVKPALSIMAASNLAYHLAERYGVHGPDGDKIVLLLTVLVVCTFVVVIWRVHTLLEGHGKPGRNPAAASGSPAANPASDQGIRQSGDPAEHPASRTGSDPAERPAAASGNPAAHPAAGPANRPAAQPANPAPRQPSGSTRRTVRQSGRGAAKPSAELRQKIRDHVRPMLTGGQDVSHAQVARDFGLDPVTGPDYVRHQVRAVSRELARP
ncbi:hypothetical protein [Streptomyces goshikiensis]|uniref:hypothetical protein n=1 Tax=Streptomyces goshikiensis TaxID=1942 RepID=UPI003814DCCE